MFPSAANEVGFTLCKVAFPPAIEKKKSLVSNAPVAFAVLNTASLNVTVIVELSAAIATPVIFGFS